MSATDRRGPIDRRRVPRGGRRAGDRPGRYPSVLVADGYAGARAVAARYLAGYSFDVAEAATGDEALQRIVATPPQVILADASLQDISARRLCQSLWENWRTRDIPVILMVGAYEPDEGALPAASVLVKPFRLAEMLDEIRRVLRIGRASAALEP